MIYYNLSVSGSSGELSESRKKKIAQTGTWKKNYWLFPKAKYWYLGNYEIIHLLFY